MQARLVTGDDDGLIGQVERPLVVGSGDVGVADGVDDQPRKVHLLPLQRPPGVEAGQQQHVLDELRHPLGLRLDAVHRVRDVVGDVTALALRQFGIPADRRKRRAQFVARVGDELAHPGLAGVPGGQRAGDAVEHPVQRGAQLPDLGVRARRVHLDDRRRQPHLAAVEFQVGHLPRGRGNR